MFSTESIGLSLESILEDPSSDLFKDFATYLHQSYCIENLAFWLATQEYYQECNKNRQQKLCESMINLYIRPNSPQEINIPCDMRQSILDFYNDENYHLHIFDDAAEAVLELMRVNSFLPWTTCSSPPSWSFENIMSSSSSCTTNSTKQHKSWPSPKRFVPSSNSLTGLSSSFSFSDKWNLIKLKQQSSRRSCSSLDYPCSIEDDSNDRLALSIEFSAPSATSTTTTTTTSGTRYRTMLKRVKRSLLGSNNNNTTTDEDEYDHFSTPRSSFTADTTSSWSSWRKSQR